MKKYLLLLVLLPACRTVYPPKTDWGYQDWPSGDRGQRAFEISKVQDAVTLSIFEAAKILGVIPPIVRVQVTKEYICRFQISNGIYMVEVPGSAYINHLHAEELLSTAVHEFVEWYYVSEELFGGSLYRSDYNNRWIGEGLATFVSNYVRHINPFPQLSANEKKEIIEDVEKEAEGIPIVDLLHFPEHGKDRLNYLAATSLIKQAIDLSGDMSILTDFHTWLLSHPGPAYEDVIQWWERHTGLSIGKLARGVPTAGLWGHALGQ